MDPIYKWLSIKVTIISHLLIRNINFSDFALYYVTANIFHLIQKQEQTKNDEAAGVRSWRLKKSENDWGQTFLIFNSGAVFRDCFLKLSSARRCLLITKSIDGPTSTNSILGTMVPDFFIRSAQWVKNTLFEDTAVHTKTRSRPARFRFVTTYIHIREIIVTYSTYGKARNKYYGPKEEHLSIEQIEQNFLNMFQLFNIFKSFPNKSKERFRPNKRSKFFIIWEW